MSKCQNPKCKKGDPNNLNAVVHHRGKTYCMTCYKPMHKIKVKELEESLKTSQV